MVGGINSGSHVVEQSTNNTSHGTGDPERRSDAGSSPIAAVASALRTLAVGQDNARARTLSTLPKETAVAGQKKAKQSSGSKHLPLEVIRNIGGALQLSALVNLSRTNKSVRAEVADLFDLRKFTENLNVGVGNFFIIETDKKATDGNALERMQNFCSDIAHLPKDQQFPLVLKLAKKIHLLPQAHQKAGYDAVRTVSDHLPLAQQDEVLSVPGMAKELNAQIKLRKEQIAKFCNPSKQESEDYFFNVLMAESVFLPARHQAETLKGICSTINYMLSDVPTEEISAYDLATRNAHIVTKATEAIMSQCASLPQELQFEVWETTIKFIKDQKVAFHKEPVIGSILKKIANLDQEHQSALVVKMIDIISDLEVFLALSIGLPKDLQAVVLKELANQITTHFYRPKRRSNSESDSRLAEAIQMQSKDLSEPHQAEVLEILLQHYSERSDESERKAGFAAIRTHSAALSSEPRATVLKKMCECFIYLPDENWEPYFETIRSASETLEQKDKTAVHKALEENMTMVGIPFE
jgi:hypothetical protein